MSKILSYMLSAVLVIICFCGIVAYADEDSDPITCVEEHFDLLTYDNYHGESVDPNPPSENSCPYATLSMLLSFYDAYWSDDFVPEDYDWDDGEYNLTTQSVVRTFSAKSETGEWKQYKTENNTDYGEFVKSDKGQSYLESYLISIAKEIGLCDDNDKVFGLNGYEMVELLEYYLYDKQKFTKEEVTVHIERAFDPGHSDETLFATMSQQIKNGFPLIYSGYSFGFLGDQDEDLNQKIIDDISVANGGHAMIAYGTVGDNDNITDIYLHTGWVNDEHTTVNDTIYNTFNLIIWIEIDQKELEHRCSKKYYDEITGESYCACQIYWKTHPKHNEKHLYVEKNNSEEHWSECICGNIINKEQHQKTYTYINRTIHIEQCELCDYNYKTIHEYYLEPTSSTEHKPICNCGKTGAPSNHVASQCVNKTKFMHNIICECGYVMGSAHHSIVTDNNRYSQCVDCGAVFDNFSDVTIKKYDDEIIPTIN